MDDFNYVYEAFLTGFGSGAVMGFGAWALKQVWNAFRKFTN